MGYRGILPQTLSDFARVEKRMSVGLKDADAGHAAGLLTGTCCCRPLIVMP
jgi:hypothetical protein